MSRRKNLFFIITACVLIFAFWVFFFMMKASEDDTQQMNKRWAAGDMLYAQVSCYFSRDAYMKPESIEYIRREIDSSLTSASLASENEDARLWIDAYSAEAQLTCEYGRRSTTAAVTAVGGDFFRFHELPLISGYYISDDELTDDRVLLDDLLAWQLFGSSDVCGMEINAAGRVFEVAGVVGRESGENYMLAYGEKPHMYMAYSAMEKINQEINVTCYEAILPSPVTGFGFNLISEKFSSYQEECVITENSARYGLKSLYKTIGLINARSMRISAIEYPYWENLAVAAQDTAAVWLLFATITLGIFVLLVIAALIAYRREMKHLWKIAVTDNIEKLKK